MLNRLARKSRQWKFETLADFARVAHEMEIHRRDGLQELALNKYLRSVTPLLSDSIEEYQQCVEDLDNAAGGIFSVQKKKSNFVFTPPAATPMEKLHRLARELRNYFGMLLAQPNAQFISQWQNLLQSRDEYHYLLRRLVGEFGNFESLIPMLPPTGSGITDPIIQQCLKKMYEINTRNIRILELIYFTFQSWGKTPDQPCHGFLKPRTFCNKLVASILLEYMIEADPVRIAARRAKATKSEKRFNPYRFWRPAENLRLMAMVAYTEGKRRTPLAKRKYVDLQLDYISPICTDASRLRWAFHEILNNCLSASSQMFTDNAGNWTAVPLPRHTGGNPTCAIFVSLAQARSRGWPKRPTMKLVFRDEGTGIVDEHLPYLTLWGYSPKRAKFLHRAEQSDSFRKKLRQEISIGGKGIGLAYASAVIQEHGGTINIASTAGEGTTVTVELPMPTQLPL